MRILVVNVAAESGGALSILRDFHAAAERDKGNEWIFLVSKPEINPSASMAVMRFPWVKKSVLHRAWFDYVMAPRIVQSCNPDVVLSLQNIVLPRQRLRQVVYLHQSLPFSDFNFDFGKSFKQWLYQKLVSSRILRGLHKADRVVVQAHWMKEAVERTTELPPDRITVIRPTVSQLNSTSYQATPLSRRRFFYPAADLEYKNHAVIYSAVRDLNASGIYDFEVILTIPDANAAQATSCIRHVGKMDFSDVQREYSNAVLVFPSVLETVGLPLLEAARARTFVVAADLPYARETLGDYPNAFYFSPNDSRQLARLMAGIMTGAVTHQQNAVRVDGYSDSWEQLIAITIGVEP